MASTVAIFIFDSLPNRATKQRHAFDADIDLDQPAIHRRAGEVKRSHVAAIEHAPLAEHAVEYRAAGIEEMQWLAALVDDIDAAGGDRRDPEVARGVNLQTI